MNISVLADTGDSMWLKLLGTFGGIAGLVALGWRIYDLFANYLQIGIVVSRGEGGAITALTSVQNKNTSFVLKNIDFAMLIVAPEYEHPVTTAKQLCPDLTFNSTNDLVHVKGRGYRGELGRAIIPLPFYTNENIAIGDESVTYRCGIGTQDWPAGTYGVRFFLFPAGRLHRSTQDLFPVFDAAGPKPFPPPQNLEAHGYAGNAANKKH